MSDKSRLKNLFHKEPRAHRHFLRRRQSKASLSLQLSDTSVGPHLLAGSTTSTDKKRRGFHPLRRFLHILRPAEFSEPQAQAAPAPWAAAPWARDYHMGREIGAGASGAVNLVTGRADGRVYALKRFRHRLQGEPPLQYLAKVRNEYAIGARLRHQNLIRTVRMLQEPAGDHFILMEYCPYDFFNLVMSGLMARGEVLCYLRQIVHGVAHLHAAGVAHRDLKLDNCVVDARGVLKLVDFGLAFEFRAPGAPRAAAPALARGIVGSDPYLSPEVLDNRNGYDPRLADVWSVAIIFCCMVLRRFPWKLPRTADPLFRAFAGLNDLDQPVSPEDMLATTVSELSVGGSRVPKYGPDRLLALLPRASRPLIAGMLAVDPEKRYLVDDVLADPFFCSIDYCHYGAADERARGLSLSLPETASADTAATGIGSASGFEKASPEPATPSANASAASATSASTTAASANASVATPASSPQTPSIHSMAPNTPELADLWSAEGAPFVPAQNHKHHLVTAEELDRLNEERERARKVKESLG